MARLISSRLKTVCIRSDSSPEMWATLYNWVEVETEAFVKREGVNPWFDSRLDKWRRIVESVHEERR